MGYVCGLLDEVKHGLGMSQVGDIQSNPPFGGAAVRKEPLQVSPHLHRVDLFVAIHVLHSRQNALFLRVTQDFSERLHLIPPVRFIRLQPGVFVPWMEHNQPGTQLAG